VTAPSKRQRRPVVLLRPVPGPSPIHDLWAGTKLIVVFAFSVLLTFFPGWVPILGIGVLVLVTARLARITRGVLPTIPWWFWLLLAFGALTAALGAGSPEVTVGSVELGLGGLLNFTRISLLAVVLLGLCMLVSWTTNVSEVAPAIATLGRPLKALRVPVDDWAVATALALRSFPMLLDEFRVLFAARKLRPRPHYPRRMMRIRRVGYELVDVLAAAITAALRRGDEMGDAITARGGTGQFSAVKAKPRRNDMIALAIVVIFCAATLCSELFLLGTSPAP
jgi:energy-coupling factor transport system permease protein